jgi:hypothetical protein
VNISVLKLGEGCRNMIGTPVLRNSQIVYNIVYLSSPEYAFAYSLAGVIDQPYPKQDHRIAEQGCPDELSAQGSVNY